MILAGEMEILGDRSVPAPLCPPQIPYTNYQFLTALNVEAVVFCVVDCHAASVLKKKSTLKKGATFFSP
jgi:hypothetical protein